ncbi:MAG: phosphoglycerol transferase MdoB-like AlkP superfamily enzyme, partial [bacterium]
LLRFSSITANSKLKGMNLVMVIIEGLPALYVGSFSKEGKGLTPNLDKIAQKSMKFSRYWGNGIYTTQGFGAMMASLPTFPKITVVSSSFFGNQFQSLPRIFSQKGYDSVFVQGYGQGSSNIDYFMNLLGMKKVVTQLEFPNYKKISDIWGIWDEFTYQRFYKEIKQLKEPFFGVVHTSTTHTPYFVPSKKWNVIPKSDPRSKWKNTIRYADWSLGQFFKKAKTLKSYKNTLFVITSDHITNTDPRNLADRGRIPLLFYTPGGQLKARESKVYGMQTDLLPTLLELYGIKTTHSAAGKSLLQKKEGEGIALHFTGEDLYWIENGTLTRFIGKEPISTFQIEKDWKTKHNLLTQTNMKPIQKNFYSYFQTVQNAIFFNRIYNK